MGEVWEPDPKPQISTAEAELGYPERDQRAASVWIALLGQCHCFGTMTLETNQTTHILGSLCLFLDLHVNLQLFQFKAQ